MKNTKSKFSVKNYFAPTPKSLRVLGDVLLGTFGTIGVSAIVQAMNQTDKEVRKSELIFAVLSILLAMVGKFLTNFFKEEKATSQTEETKSEDIEGAQ